MSSLFARIASPVTRSTTAKRCVAASIAATFVPLGDSAHRLTRSPREGRADHDPAQRHPTVGRRHRCDHPPVAHRERGDPLAGLGGDQPPRASTRVVPDERLVATLREDPARYRERIDEPGLGWQHDVPSRGAVAIEAHELQAARLIERRGEQAVVGLSEHDSDRPPTTHDDRFARPVEGWPQAPLTERVDRVGRGRVIGDRDAFDGAAVRTHARRRLGRGAATRATDVDGWLAARCATATRDQQCDDDRDSWLRRPPHVSRSNARPCGKSLRRHSCWCSRLPESFQTFRYP